MEEVLVMFTIHKISDVNVISKRVYVYLESGKRTMTTTLLKPFIVTPTSKQTSRGRDGVLTGKPLEVFSFRNYSISSTYEFFLSYTVKRIEVILRSYV